MLSAANSILRPSGYRSGWPSVCTTTFACGWVEGWASRTRRAQGGLATLFDVLGFLMFLAGDDVQSAKQAMHFAAGAGGKEQCVDRLIVQAIAEGEPPQAVDLDRLVVGALQPAHPFTACQIEGVDQAIAEVGHQQPVGEASEPGGSDRHAPGGVERALRDQAIQEAPARVEHADEAEAAALDVVMAGGILLGIADVDVAIDRLQAERRIAGREVGIAEWPAG